MTIFILLFLLSLLGGQLMGWSVISGVVIYAHDVMLALFLVYAGWTKRLKSGVVSSANALFVLVGIISLFLNITRFSIPELGLGSLYLVRWGLYSMLYDVVEGSGAYRRRVWPWGLYGFGVLFACFGLVQYFLYPDLRNLTYLGWDPHYWRLVSTLLDPNFAGIVLVLAFLFGFILWTSIKPRVLLLISQTILFVSLLLTYSRSSFVAFIAALASLAILRRQKAAESWIVALFLVGIAVLPLRGVSILQITREETAIARVSSWGRGWELFARSPIFGFGFDTLRLVQGRLGWVDDSQMVSHAGAGIDNSFLVLLATTGVVGFGFYLAIFWKLLRQALGLHNIFGYVTIASVIAVFFHAMFINSLFYPWVMIWIWIVAGLL